MKQIQFFELSTPGRDSLNWKYLHVDCTEGPSNNALICCILEKYIISDKSCTLTGANIKKIDVQNSQLEVIFPSKIRLLWFEG